MFESHVSDLPDSMHEKARKDVKEALCRRLFKDNQIEALVPNNKKKRLTIKKRAQYCAKTRDVWDIYLYALDLAETKNNVNKEIVASSSCLSQFRKELAEARIDPKQINTYAKLQNVTQASNKIQKRKLEQGLISRSKIPKHFFLEEELRKLRNISTTLCIIYYEPDESNPLEWYNPNYSWYCTGYIKNKEEAKNNFEPQLFLSMEKNPEHMDRHDSGMYYAESDTSDSDLDSDLEPKLETLASTPKPINKNTSEIEDIYNLYRSI
ncbi:4663_t:CDS:2 [Dentiscutata erythropus]|uniref:4663_t:CDS:1 n=1 Tax=Dentiscutata erythropus TaxID=1348616 RepID=A0A9N9GUA8_9GLOM|nr:4663_t:CDS:2 [Dentiscutata erythropus]